MYRVKHKVAIVTGGALGIGRATCLLLAQEGAKVAVTDLLIDKGKSLVEDIRATGGEAEYWHLDVSQESEVQRVFAAVEAKWGKIDILVNNAGMLAMHSPTHETTAARGNGLMVVNVNGVALCTKQAAISILETCTKHAVPFMLKTGGSSIINLSSTYGLVEGDHVPPYHASQAAVRLMSKTDALLYAKNNIRVNSVHPAYIGTTRVEKLLAQEVSEGCSAADSLHPLGRTGEPDDIAYGILYFASDESKFVTGAELVIDGGHTTR